MEPRFFPGFRSFRWILLAVAVALVVPDSPAAQSSPATAAPVNLTTSWSDEQIEQFLLKAEIGKTKTISKGVTGALKASLSDGTVTHDAQIQQVDEKKLTGPAASGSELNFRDSWAFNVAAYRLDRLIGLKLVPVSVSRDYKSKGAAFTWWIDDVMMDEGERLKKNAQPPNALRWNETMSLIRLFDQLIYNVDRNQGNMLMTKDWTVWAIDHTRAFRLHKNLKTPASITRCDREVFEKLKQLDEEKLKTALSEFLTVWERNAILARRDAIVAILEKAGPGALFSRTEITTAAR